MGRHRINSQLAFNGPGHPTFFRYGLRLAPGMSYQLVNNQLLLRDDQGVEVMRVPAPIGEDSSTVAPTPDGTLPIRTTLTEDGTFNGNPIFRLDLDQDDLASAVYPVRV